MVESILCVIFTYCVSSNMTSDELEPLCIDERKY